MGSLNMLNPVSWIPDKYLLLAKIVAVGLLVIAAFAWWSAHNAGQQKIGYDRAADEYQTKLDEATEAARNKEDEWQEKWRVATNERAETENKLALSRAAAAAADDRLRRATDDWRNRLSVASVEACRTAASTAAGLLGECSAAYRDVAAAASGHLADLRQCESAWPE